MSPRASVGAVSLAAGAVLLTSNLLHADDRHPSVALDIGACLDVEKDEVRRIVAIELRALMTHPDQAGAVTRVAVDCYNPLVEIRVDDPVTGKTLGRRIDLSSTERSIRARLLALSIAELVSSSWTELVSNPEPTVVPIGTLASDDERKAARDVVTAQTEERERPARFAVAATGRRFLGAGAWLLGGEVRFLPRLGMGALSLSGDVNHGTANASLGDVSITTATAGVGWLVHLSDQHRWVLDFGPELHVGAVWLNGTARSTERVTGRGGAALLSGPAIDTRIGLVLWNRTELTLESELGYALAGANGRVAGAAEVRVGGLFAGLAMGIGVTR